MTFEAYRKNQNKIKMNLKYLGGLFTLYCMSLLIYKLSFLNLLIIILAGVFICLIPGLLFFHMIQEKKTKKNKINMEGHSLLYPYKCKRFKGNFFNTYELIIVPYMVLAWMYLFELSGMGLFLIINIPLMVIMGILLLFILRKLYEYPIIFYNKGLIIHHKSYEYKAIKKYQWIKMRSGNMILELQLKDVFTSFVFDHNTALEIEGHLKNIV
jgi:hypothetical protein